MEGGKLVLILVFWRGGVANLVLMFVFGKGDGGGGGGRFACVVGVKCQLSCFFLGKGGGRTLWVLLTGPKRKDQIRPFVFSSLVRF